MILKATKSSVFHRYFPTLFNRFFKGNATSNSKYFGLLIRGFLKYTLQKNKNTVLIMFPVIFTGNKHLSQAKQLSFVNLFVH